MMTTLYSVESAGVQLGYYPGAWPRDAITAMYRDAGHDPDEMESGDIMPPREVARVRVDEDATITISCPSGEVAWRGTDMDQCTAILVDDDDENTRLLGAIFDVASDLFDEL